jgi:CRP-like cAMP-binding protein
MSWLVDVAPAHERARIESTLASCPRLSLPAGASFGADRFESTLLVSVEDGIVCVSAANRDSPRRVVVNLAGAGSILLAPAPHERLEALADARVTPITAAVHRRLLAIAAAAIVIVDALGSGLRDCRDSLTLLGNRHHTDRVREKLIQLARSHGRVGAEGLLLDVPLTHELLADMVGSTRETVTRSLGQLAQEGIVSHERGRYRVVAPPEAPVR